MYLLIPNQSNSINLQNPIAGRRLGCVQNSGEFIITSCAPSGIRLLVAGSVYTHIYMYYNTPSIIGPPQLYAHPLRPQSLAKELWNILGGPSWDIIWWCHDLLAIRGTAVSLSGSSSLISSTPSFTLGTYHTALFLPGGCHVIINHCNQWGMCYYSDTCMCSL